MIHTAAGVNDFGSESKNMEQIAVEAGIDFLENSERKKSPGAVVAITIPSIEYPDQYKTYLPVWRQEFKEEGLVHCPNYKDCGFKCTTVNGMKYHFVRCLKSDPPEFTCAVCKKKFQCRTGLVWHLKKHHDLINIQPTKGTAFRGTIPVEAYQQVKKLGRIHSGSSDDSLLPPVRKKRRVEPKIPATRTDGVIVSLSGGRGGGGGGKVGSGSGQKRDHSPGQRRKSRKSFNPRPTDYTYLQNLFDCYSLPVPVQAPPTPSEIVHLTEYRITEEVEAEVFVYGSGDLIVDETALEWSKMSDDSESEIEEMFVGHEAMPSPSLLSDSSVSDGSSDEEYMCSLTKKKPKPKKVAVLKAKKEMMKLKQRRPPSESSTPSCFSEGEIIAGKTGLKPGVMSLPPQLIRTDGQSVLKEVSIERAKIISKPVSKLVRPEAPPLIKTPTSPSTTDRYIVSQHSGSEIRVVPGNTMVGRSKHKELPSQQHLHRQLPKLKPKLDHMTQGRDHMTQGRDHMTQGRDHMTQGRDHMTQGRDHMTQGRDHMTQGIDHMTSVVNIAKSPQVILSSGIKRLPPPLVSSKSHDASHNSKSHTHTRVLSMATTTSPKSHHHHSHTHSRSHKTSKKVSIDPILLGPSPKSSSSRTSSKNVPPLYTSSPSKKIKPTVSQYGVITSSHKSPSSHIYQSGHQHTTFQGVQLPTNIPHVMTPLQLVSPTQNQPSLTATSQGVTTYQQAVGSSGGLILLQGATPQTNSVVPTYFSQGGQTYQVIHQNESAQKVSVIMQPPVGTTYLASTDLQGGIQYISQLDGPPDQEKPAPVPGEPGKDSQKKTQQEVFEKMRHEEQEKLGLSPGGSVSSKNVTPTGDQRGTIIVSLQGVDKSPPDEPTKGQSAEQLMSEKLQFYLTKEKERAKTVAEQQSKSPPATQPSDITIPQGSLSLPGQKDSPTTSLTKQAHSDSSSQSLVKKRKQSSTDPPRKSPSSGPPRSSSRLIVSPALFSYSMSPRDASGQISSATPGKGAGQKGKKLKKKQLIVPEEIITDSDRELVEPISETSPLNGQTGLVGCTSETETLGTELISNGTKASVVEGQSSNNGMETEDHSHTANEYGLESRQGGTHVVELAVVDMEPGQSTEGMELDSVLGKHLQKEQIELTTPPRKRGRPSGKGRGRGRGRGTGRSATPVSEARHVTLTASLEQEAASGETPITSCPIGQNSDAIQDSVSGELHPESESQVTPPPKRKRGRPRKSKVTISGQTSQDSHIETETECQDLSETPITRTRKKKRDGVEDTDTGTGQTDQDTFQTESESTPIRTPKRRGRPRTTPDSGHVRSFDCTTCNLSFTTKYLLQNHTDMEHPLDLGPEATLEDYLPVWKRTFKRLKHLRCHVCKSYKATSIPSMKYHFSRCGKTQEELAIACDVCGKTYTSKQGLIYHMKSQHTQPYTDHTPQDNNQESASLTQAPSSTSRVAAQRARNRLHTLITQLKPEDNGTVSTETNSPAVATATTSSKSPSPDAITTTKSRKSPKTDWEQSVVTEEEMKEIRKKFNQSGGPMNCPIPNCVKMFTTYPGIRYHLLHHNPTRSSYKKCSKCGKKFLGEKRLQRHIYKKHTEGATSTVMENPSDEEYDPDGHVRKGRKGGGRGGGSASDSSDDELGEEGSDIETPSEGGDGDEMGGASTRGDSGVLRRKKSSSLSYHLIGPRLSNIPVRYRGNNTFQSYVRKVLDRVRNRSSAEEEGEKGFILFPDWLPHPSAWKQISLSDSLQYVPETVPVPFSLHNSTIAQTHTTHTLTRSKSLVTDGSMAIFSVGGPVWAMDWAPVTTATANHILAVAPYRDRYDFFQMESAFTMKGNIQIWDVGNISMATKTPPTPRLSLTVAHEFGVVRELKWCPSGCYEVGETIDGEREYRRLGLLAVASSDGFTRILSIPNLKTNSESETDSSTIVIPKSVAAVLVPYGMGSPNTTPTFQCLCVDWLPSNNHSKIAAGFSNGMVCIWDLNCEFQIVPTQDGQSRTVHPLIEILAQSGLCSSLAWCPVDTNYICTGGKDRSVNVWDIRQPQTPVDSHVERGAFFLRELAWSFLWPAVFTISGITSTIQLISYSHQLPGNRPTRIMAEHYAPTSSMSYCIWSDRLVASTFSGEVTVTTVPTSFYRRDIHKLYLQRVHKVILDTKVEMLATANAGGEKEDTGGREGEGAELLYYVHNPRKIVGEYTVQQPLLPSINIVRWNGNETCHEWLALGTNSGLVHIIHVPKPTEKPDLYTHRRTKRK